MKTKNDRKNMPITNSPNGSKSKLLYRSKTPRLVSKSSGSTRGKIDKKRTVSGRKKTPSPKKRSLSIQSAAKLRQPVIKKLQSNRKIIEEEEDNDNDDEEDSDEEELDSDSDSDVQEIHEIEIDDDDDGDIQDLFDTEDDGDESGDESSNQSVILLESESIPAPSNDRSISITFSPPKKLLTMARKSTSPLKILPRQLVQNNAAIECDGILEKRELIKNEKLTASSTSNGNGKALNQNAIRKKNENIQNKQIPVLSTSSLIDYFIMGSKEFEKSLVASHHVNLNNSNSLEEFRKACKIYAEIGIRHRYHPSFLNRNLSYLVEERNKKSRKKRRFKVNDLLKLKSNEPSLANDSSPDVFFKVVSIDVKNHEDKEKIAKSAQSKLSFRCFAFRKNIDEQLDFELTLDKFDYRKTGELILVPKSAQELKFNSNLYPFICMELKTSSKTQRSICSIEKLLPKSNAKESSIEITLTLEDEKLANKENKQTKESMKSAFLNANQVKMNIRRISSIKPKVGRPSQSQLNGHGSVAVNKIKKEKTPKTTNKQVFYMFTSANTNRMSETKIRTCHSGVANPFECPFCHLNTLASDSTLLNHLTHSHPRFAAQIVPNGGIPDSIRIEVMIDPLYDASYASKHEHHLLGYPQSLHGPKRLIDYMIRNTHVIVNKRVTNLYLAKCRGHSDFEIIEKQVIAAAVEQALKNDDANINRVFYHTNTWQPVRSERELEEDSDEETAPEWLREHTRLLINDFSDLNEGEKWFMHAWNIHCLNSHAGIYNRQVMDVCTSFITRETPNIVRASLQRNFISHLRNLIDYGLLTVDAFIRLVDLFNEMIRNFNMSKL